MLVVTADSDRSRLRSNSSMLSAGTSSSSLPWDFRTRRGTIHFRPSRRVAMSSHTDASIRMRSTNRNATPRSSDPRQSSHGTLVSSACLPIPRRRRVSLCPTLPSATPTRPPASPARYRRGAEARDLAGRSCRKRRPNDITEGTDSRCLGAQRAAGMVAATSDGGPLS